MKKIISFIKKIHKKCFGNTSSKIVTLSVISGAVIMGIFATFIIIAVKTEKNRTVIQSNYTYNASKKDETDSSANNETPFSPENSSSGNDTSNSESSAEKWETVEKADMPTGINGLTMTQAEAESKYRAHTDWRIYSVRTTETSVTPSNGGTAYYISNSGSSRNDGLSPEKPKKNLSDLQNLELKSGDVVYFERGGVWRGSFTANVAGVTYSAYGEGKKPEIYSYIKNVADENDWEETDTENVYALSFTIKQDVGNIIINGGEKTGTKAVIKARNTDNSSNVTTGKAFFGYYDLEDDLHFFHDTYSDGTLYLYSENGNPGKIFDSIELGIKSNIISVTAADVTIDNLCLKYGGAHGVGAGSKATGLTVQNCEFGYIGGSIQAENIFGRDYGTRYGNAVEIYGSAIDFTVKNNYIYQIYDAGITFQYSGTAHCVMENINFSDNIIEYCNYSIEYFLTADDTSYIKNVLISNNLMWYAGYGLCEQRPDKNCDSHIKGTADSNPNTSNFDITNNLFLLANTSLLRSKSKFNTAPAYSGNTYIQFADGLLGINGSTEELRFSEAKSFIPLYFFDDNASIIFVK